MIILYKRFEGHKISSFGARTCIFMLFYYVIILHISLECIWVEQTMSDIITVMKANEVVLLSEVHFLDFVVFLLFRTTFRLAPANSPHCETRKMYFAK